MKRMRLWLIVGLAITLLACGRFIRLHSLLSGPSPSGMDESFFPIGFMGVYQESSRDGTFSAISDTSIEIVHEFKSVQEVAQAEYYLEAAKESGLKVVQNMPTCRAYNSQCHSICLEENVDVWGEREWAEFISSLARHDNLIAWYLPDEIDDYVAAADLYRWVHKYDPQERPVFGNPGTYRQLIVDLFPSFADFVWTSAYPNHYEEPRALVIYAMRRDAQACRDRNTRWGAILQLFDSKDFGGTGGYPTAHEIRSDSYQSIVGGATGLWYFSYARGQDLTDLLTEIDKISREITGPAGLDEIILSPTVPQTITTTIISGPTESPPVRGEAYDAIQTLQKEHNGTHLFAVNIAAGTVTAEFSGLPSETIEVEVLFEERTIAVSDGAFRDRFAESDVHIYRVVDAGDDR